MLRILLIAIAFALPLSAAQAQSKLGPYTDVRALADDKPGHVIHALIEATNSGDEKKVKDFLLANASKDFLDALPMEEHIGRIAGIGAENGGFKFYAIRQTEASKADPSLKEFVVQGLKSKEWFQVSLSFVSDKEFKIANLDAAPIPAPEK